MVSLHNSFKLTIRDLIRQLPIHLVIYYYYPEFYYSFYSMFTESTFLEENNAQLVKACSTNMCNSSQCIAEAEHYKSIVNWEIDPCDDFHEFVCGRYRVGRSDLAEIKTSYYLHDLQKNITDQLFEEVLRVNESDLLAFKTLKAAYVNCMNESLVRRDGLETLKQIIEKIGGWPILVGSEWDDTGFRWTETVSKINSVTKITFPFTIDVRADYRDFRDFMIVLKTATPALLSSEKDLNLKTYRDFIRNATVAMGADNGTDISAEIDQIIEFERSIVNLKNLHIAEEEMKMHHFTIHELYRIYPSIPWLDLLHHQEFIESGIFIHHNEQVVSLFDPEFFRRLEKLLEVTPSRVIANYLSWSVVSSAFLDVSQRSRARLFDSDVPTGVELLSTEEWCRRKIGDTAGLKVSLSSLYARRFFDGRGTRRDVVEMFENVKSQLKKRFHQIDWLDGYTRRAAIDKIEATNAIIGFDDELLDDDKIEDYYRSLRIESREPFYKNALSLKLFGARQNYKLLRESVDPNYWLWHEKSSTVDGFYVPIKNRVVLPVGLITSLFKPGRPEYLNYAQIGAFTGHEIVHGFDRSSIKIDKVGNPRDWFQTMAKNVFNRIADCFIEQYSQFTLYDTGFRTNGVFTLDENICDNGGFKAAYNAYVDLVRGNNIQESCLPSLPLTPRQTFWVSSASMWCRHFSTKEDLNDTIIKDNHSPGQARVNVAFSNMKEFAEDFNCKIGTKMNPEEKCVLW